MASVPAATDSQPAESGNPSGVDSLAFSLFFALGLTVMQRVVGFLRTILFCRLLPEDQLGQWALVFSFLLLVAPIAVLGLPGCFGRYVEYYRARGELRSFLLKVGGTTFLSSLILLVGLVLFREQVSWLVFRSADQGELVLAMLAVTAAVIASNFCFELMEAMRQVRLVSWMRFLSSLVFAVSGVGLIYLLRSGAIAVSLAYLIGSAVACIPAIYYLSGNWAKISADNQCAVGHATLWKKLAPFAAWLWVVNLLTNLFGASDRYMLLHFSHVSAEEAQGLVGQYHSGRFMPMLLVGVATLIGGIVMPYLSAHWEAGKRTLVGDYVRLLVKLTSIGFTCASLALLVLAPIVFDWLLQGRYNDGLSVLPLTLTYCVWMSVAILAQDYLWVSEKGRLPSIAIFAGLVVNVIANAAMVPHFGLMGAVVGTALANAIVLGGIYWLNSREGWNIDRGVCILFAFPMILCTPPNIAIVAAISLLVFAWKTEWVFAPEEKEELERHLARFEQQCRAKISRR